MEIVHTPEHAKAVLRPLQERGRSIGFVPTMGALHHGHLSLIAAARARADVVVASVFVNPKQFGEAKDLEAYPRDLDADARRLEAAGCSLLFAPSIDAMYPPGFQTEVRVTEVARGLEGAQRPGHFEGVATVVLKLFGIVRPDVAVFGEKDYQQLVLVRRMALDLGLDVEIVGAPLVREEDGVAASSRNVRLDAHERTRARALSEGLRAARAAFEAGERRAAELLDAVRGPLAREQLAPDYLELRHASDLSKLERADEPCVILLAVRVGSTRLLDNHILRRP